MTQQTDTGIGPNNAAVGYIATACDALVVVTAVASVVLGTVGTLLVWEAVSVLYMLCTALAVKYLVRRDAVDPRTGTLDVLSWLFPLAASLGGVNAALTALVGHAEGASTVASVAGLFGIPISWLLLHIGFANIYAFATDRSARAGNDNHSMFGFPNTTIAGPVEYIYFAFTIGATFATSDVDVRTRQARVLVTAHSVVSFFFNALVVAAAFQVLQRLA